MRNKQLNPILTYQSLKFYESDFDEQFLNDRISMERLKQYLLLIINQIMIEENSKFLQGLFILFRKWNVIFEGLFPNEPEINIENIDQYYSFRKNAIRKKKFDKQLITESQNLSAFIEALHKVDPYNAFKKNALDQNLFSSEKLFNIFTKINQAVILYKQSKLAASRKNILFSINNLETIDLKKIDQITLYLYSWSYHILGNIAFVQNRMSWAETCYSTSLKIKERLNGLPLYITYVTKAKMVFSQVWRLTHNRWRAKLLSLNDEINQIKEFDDNSEQVKNLLGDLFLYISKANRYLNELKTAKKFCDDSITLAFDTNDQVGVIRNYILYGLIEYRYGKWVDKTDHYLKHELDSSKKNNPYIKSIISLPTIDEIAFSKKGYSDRLVTVFSLNGITPFKQKEIDFYNTVYMNEVMSLMFN